MSRSRQAGIEAVLSSSAREPLRSIRRHDGLWESIETDDGHITKTEPIVRAANIDCRLDRVHVSSRSVGVQTSPGPFSEYENAPPAYTSEMATAARASEPNIGAQNIQHSVVANLLGTVPGDIASIDGPRRRRGRPRNATGFRNRRSVRFSDPISSDHEPTLVSRDSHIFIRLLNVVFQEPEQMSTEPMVRRRQEYFWNNRGKGWRAAERRSDEGLVQIVNLFDLVTGGGVEIYPVIQPTERGGARQPIQMGWDNDKACFMGRNQDEETVSVALGEMKDMARDPWARQFVGHITS